MRVGIVGYRRYTDYISFKKVIKAWEKEHGNIQAICSGGAPGADTLAERYAHDFKKKIKVYPAEWDVYGRAAGPIRNKKIVDYSDFIIAFVCPRSKGTFNTINIAKSNDKSVFVYNI